MSEFRELIEPFMSYSLETSINEKHIERLNALLQESKQRHAQIREALLDSNKHIAMLEASIAALLAGSEKTH
jgi:DNA-binding FadR family transcriptional regulator